MIKVPFEHIAAELAVGPAEQQMLVPHLVDDFGRCDDEITHHAQVDELPVFFDCPQGKCMCPTQFSGKLAGERLCRRVRSTEYRPHMVLKLGRHEFIEVVIFQPQPELLFHSDNLACRLSGRQAPDIENSAAIERRVRQYFMKLTFRP